jgi:glutamyl-Q tRNA(Asp) synthetase
LSSVGRSSDATGTAVDVVSGKRYVGRFAPSPTGLLHAGSMVAALASWLDARARDGTWLLRIEDLDTQRNVDGAAEAIVGQLERCGLRPDLPVLRQSEHTALYEAALEKLLALGRAFPCACSRRDLALAATAPDSGGDASAGAERVYPGTCRAGLGGKPARSIRLLVESSPCRGEALVEWHDRRLGAQRQDVARAVGDFVLKRADGVFAYQLAVVVDDAAQGITDVVRGEDLAGSTARQIVLQRLLGVPTPRYLHTPLVRATDGSKLSKQTGAVPLDLAEPLAALRAAGAVLGIEAGGTRVAAWLEAAIEIWRERVRRGQSLPRA